MIGWFNSLFGGSEEVSEDQAWLDEHLANLSPEEREWLEGQLATGAGIYRVYPPSAGEGESHWSDGSMTYDPTSNVRYGCFPDANSVPIEINEHTTIYMTPEAAREWERQHSFLGGLIDFARWLFEGW